MAALRTALALRRNSSVVVVAAVGNWKRLAGPEEEARGRGMLLLRPVRTPGQEKAGGRSTLGWEGVSLSPPIPPSPPIPLLSPLSFSLPK